MSRIAKVIERNRRSAKKADDQDTKRAQAEQSVEPGKIADVATPSQLQGNEQLIEFDSLPLLETSDEVLAENRIITKFNTKHPSLSAYRMLRTRVLQRLRSHSWNIIGMAAPDPGAGKTLTAINLAISIAGELEQEAILVDFDLRRPSICEYLGISPKVSISNFIEDPALTARECVASIGIKRLGVVVNDVPIDNSSDILGSARTRQLIAELREGAPDAIIVLDLPPILATDDALVLAPQIDAFLMIVAEGTTRRDQAQRMAELLQEQQILGAILNKSRDKMTNEYYYY